MKKTAALILLCFFLLQSFYIQTAAEEETESGIRISLNTEGLDKPSPITAPCAVLINLETGKPIYEKNAGKKIEPASTVKIMTGILILENITDTSRSVTVTKSAVANTSGSNIKLLEGEEIKLIDLIYATLIYGANDAAKMLAEYVAGDIEAFVKLMNEKAKSLGCDDTVFTNVHGLHSDSMSTTAADIAKIAHYASKIQLYMDITSAPKYTIPKTNLTSKERTFYNKNHFVSKAQQANFYYPSAVGMNAGSTAEAGYYLVTAAMKNGMSYLCVIAGATSTKLTGEKEIINSFSDAKDLLDWAFSIYTYKTVLTEKDIICSVDIKLAANNDSINLMPDKKIESLLPRNADIEIGINKSYNIYEDKLTAPITKGQQLGELIVTYNGETLGTANLIASSSVERSNILYTLERIKEILSTRWFGASIIIFIILFIFYIVISYTRSRKKEKKRFY